jgi:hypothetical protein
MRATGGGRQLSTTADKSRAPSISGYRPPSAKRPEIRTCSRARTGGGGAGDGGTTQERPAIERER